MVTANGPTVVVHRTRLPISMGGFSGGFRLPQGLELIAPKALPTTFTSSASANVPFVPEYTDELSLSLSGVSRIH